MRIIILTTSIINKYRCTHVIYIYIYMYIYTHIYIHIRRKRERERDRERERAIEIRGLEPELLAALRRPGIRRNSYFEIRTIRV